MAADPGLAPNLLVLDTNILLKEMSYIQILVADLKKHSEVDASILIPREVYRELDTLKNKLGATYRVRATVRYLEGLRSTRLKDQRYPLLRVQVCSLLVASCLVDCLCFFVCHRNAVGHCRKKYTEHSSIILQT